MKNQRIDALLLLQLFGLLTLGLLTRSALAQIALPPVGGGVETPTTPRTATLTAPKGTKEGHEGWTLSLEWTQHLSSPQGHPPAEHFVICMYDPAVKNCATTPLRWVLPANQIQRVASGSFGYAYTFALPSPLSATELDRPLQWKVGACRTTAEGSCAFATAHVWLSTKNLRAGGSGIRRHTEHRFAPPEIRAVASTASRGSTQSGTFRYETALLRAVATAQDTCETDVTRAYNAGLADTALTRHGEELDLATLPRRADGTIEVGNRAIVAVYALSQPTTMVADVAGFWDFPVDSGAHYSRIASSPYAGGAYALRHRVDVDAAIVEYDETDNGSGWCESLPAATPPPDMLLTVGIKNPSIEVIVQSQPTGLVCTLFNAGNCSQSYPSGTLVTLSASGPLVGWSGCDSAYGGYCEVTLNTARAVTAEFRRADSLPSLQP